MAYIGNPAAPTLAQVSDNTITSAKIVDGAVTPSDLSTGHPTWDSSGNVGIGTASPDRSFHIVGTEPSVVLENSGQGVDLKTWRIYSNSSSLQIGTVDDAFASGQNAMEFTRDNTDNITSIQFKTGASNVIGRWTTDGLCFNGDTAAANALDDYEEGTWTPRFEGLGSNPTVTYTNQYGYYRKVGSLVYCALRLTINTTSGGSGMLVIRGMPFSIASLTQLFSVMNIGYGEAFITAMPTFGRWYQTTNFLELYYRNTATSESPLQISNIQNGTDLILNFTYISA